MDDKYLPDLKKAILCLNHFAFYNLNFCRVYSLYREDNYFKESFWNSLRFVHEGIWRNHIHSNGKFYNAVNKGLLKHEYDRFFLSERNVDRTLNE
jgi:hypothetical protein